MELRICLSIIICAIISLCVRFCVADEALEITTPRTSSLGDQLEIHRLSTPANCERKSKATDLLTVHFRGWLENGDEFDSSYDAGKPFIFQLGVGQMIRGWEQALIGVCPEERLRLVVPPSLAYGDSDTHEKVPPNSTLTFEVEVLAITSGPIPVNVFEQIDLNHDRQLTRDEVAHFLKKQHDMLQEHHPERDPTNLDELDEMVETIFQHEDRNDDGLINHNEFSGPKHDHDEL